MAWTPVFLKQKLLGRFEAPLGLQLLLEEMEGAS